MSALRTILWREIRSYARQRRTMLVLILLSAGLANAGYGVVSVSPLVHLSFMSRYARGVDLSGHRDLAQSALVWIGLLPVLFSAQQAAITIAAERERRSLTALLAAPISMVSILAGKLFGSLMPGLLMLLVAYAVYLARIAYAAADSTSWLPLTMVLAVILLLVCTASLLNSLALIVSALAPTVAAASITATFVLLPFTLALAAISIRVSDLGAAPIAVAAVATGLLAALVVLATSRLLHRTHLLTVQ
jgi:ABC-type Na+ efflux pump permease subunit